MRSVFKLCLLAFSLPVFAQPAPLLVNGLEVHAGTIEEPADALLYAARLESYTDLMLVNPGGEIPAAAMSGLAEELARTGSIVYVLKNPNNLPILAPTLPAVFAASIHSLDVPEVIKTAQSSRLPVRVLGHSLGGAVLGQEIGNPSSKFQDIILIGVSRLVSTPEKPAVKVTVLLGEKDGLVSRQGVATLAEIFQTPVRLLPEVNHFCIISDPKVGAADKKALDLPTALTAAQCVSRVVETIRAL